MKKFVSILLVAAAGMAAGSAADSVALWEQHCASCHAKDGSGSTRMGKKSGVKDYRDAKVQSEMKDDKAFEQVKGGINENGKERMKAYKDKLSDDDIKALIAHVRTFGKK